MNMTFKLMATAALLAMGATPALAQKASKAQKPAAGQQSLSRIDGKPNLNGIWQTMSGANWNVEPHSAAPAPAAQEKLGAIGAIPASPGVVEGGAIPYKPEAVKLRDENRGKAPTWDPEAACYLPGIPRATYMDHPFQIVQGDKDDLLFVYEYASANRIIHMKPVEIPPIDTWMGTSFGEWEGDTLKVVTLGLSPGDIKAPGGELYAGVTWLDRSGNYVTSHATVTERFTPEGPNLIRYEVTIDDPDTFTKPWKMSMPIYRRMEANAELQDFRCVPFSEELLYGDLRQGQGAAK